MRAIATLGPILGVIASSLGIWLRVRALRRRDEPVRADRFLARSLGIAAIVIAVGVVLTLVVMLAGISEVNS